jgi:sugar phosphate isomerase/epimerase
MTRRKLVTGLATAAAVAQERPRPVEWKPRLGILGPFSEANVRFAKEEGFTNMILGATRRSTMDPTSLSDAQIENVKQVLSRYGMHVSAFQASQNHIAPDPNQRKQDNDYFVKLMPTGRSRNRWTILFVSTPSAISRPARRIRCASCGNHILWERTSR